VLWDVLAAVFFVALDTTLTLAGTSWWPAHPGPLAWSMLAVQAVACMSLVARSRAPIAVVVVLLGFTLAISLLAGPAHAITPAHGGAVWAPFATVLAAYGPVQYAGSRTAAGRRRAFAAIALLTLVAARPWDPSLAVLTTGVLRTAAGPLVAMYLDARRRLVQALTERAERAEREQHLLAEQARAEERARLAAEMHDIVTHRVSLMVLQAGALRVTSQDERIRQTAEELRVAGCRALDELRDLVGILRATPGGEPAGESPEENPAAAIATLAAESTAVGLPTELLQDGDPALASPVVGRTACRVVREALTNVRKHAPGAHVTVRVRYEPTRVTLTVDNTAATTRPDPALVGTGSGLGIEGLRRRIELVHGTLHTGPVAGGGFRVAAELPAYVPAPAPQRVPEEAGQRGR
jgi:signal transduction histidine kinase